MKIQTVALALAIALPGAVIAAGDQNGYAEGLYRDYTEMSQGQFRFDVEVLGSGPLEKLQGQPMLEITGAPKFSLLLDEDSDIRLPKVGVIEPNLEDIYLQDLAESVDSFPKHGYPLELGSYRLLEVKSSLGADSRSHRAVEFCWQTLSHCVVFDPNIDFIDSAVNSFRSARAAGWGLHIHEGDELPGLDQGASSKARCGLASNPSVTARSYSRGARTVTYKNLFGITMVGKNIGAVQAGLRCSSSCRPSPYGYANASSAWSNIPFSVACGNRANSGTSGGRGKFVAKSGCAHRTVLGAKFSATAKGVALSADVQIDATGSIDMNGTEYIDTCGMY